MKKLFLLYFILLVSCDNGSKNPELFISKAKKVNLKLLSNVNIEARNKKDHIFHYSYFHVFKENDTLIVPSFEFFDSVLKNDTTIYRDVMKFSDNDLLSFKEKIELVRIYSKEIDNLYKTLGVVNVKSNPNLGNFIEFTLDENCKVYYLRDSESLNAFWKINLEKLKNLETNWYCNCMEQDNKM